MNDTQETKVLTPEEQATAQKALEAKKEAEAQRNTQPMPI